MDADFGFFICVCLRYLRLDIRVFFLWTLISLMDADFGFFICVCLRYLRLDIRVFFVDADFAEGR